MKLSLYILFTLGKYALAATYTFDQSCTAVRLQGGNIIDVTRRIETAMHEAIEMAENAFEVMDRESTNPKVQEMIKIVLGDDTDKFRRGKAMEDKLFYNKDVEVFKRYYEEPYDLENPNANLPGKAATTDSDLFDKLKWAQDEAYLTTISRKDPQYSTPIRHLACQIDLSTWHLDERERGNWPNLDVNLVETAMGEEFINTWVSGGTSGRRTPVDALSTFGGVLLHEAQKDPGNSDTISLLGQVLKLWKMGYWVDDKGYIHTID
ncbi:uncharacterized protein K460DRAFT_359716 [Cucurbitaria berberidis CBS 394.84]|uniref:Uncharacterized protein n=1 Tax=Cucurbitaria berberidis CBS 394.84 TaxID=1168544 RepID=A0A9P4G977_9PLEO|nr:uncharacterized protein K460DRAFT_359716 [Cucurbitaria berberidis CBS 394.84]KAF1841196.1 hypothetical protein K460DRAFT_359716 [Cucurbitaria berberidis CBS 394.84]